MQNFIADSNCEKKQRSCRWTLRYININFEISSLVFSSFGAERLANSAAPHWSSDVIFLYFLLFFWLRIISPLPLAVAFVVVGLSKSCVSPSIIEALPRFAPMTHLDMLASLSGSWQSQGRAWTSSNESKCSSWWMIDVSTDSSRCRKVCRCLNSSFSTDFNVIQFFQFFSVTKIGAVKAALVRSKC